MSNVPEIFDKPPSLDVETKNKVETAMLESLLTDEVQNALKLDVDSFTANTIMLNQRFREVENLLIDFDKEKLSDPLAPAWSKFRQTYTDLVTKSERVATSISKAADSYLTTIVKPAAALHKKGTITADDLKELKEEIQDFIDENKKSDKAASDIKVEFTTLISEIETFRDNFSKFGEKTMSDNETKIKAIDDKLKILNEELDSINGHVARSQQALIGSGIGTGILVTATAFFPIAAIAIFAAGALAAGGSAIALAVFTKQANEKRGEIKTEEDKKKALRAENDRIIQIRKDLKELGENQIKDVLGGLEFFREIWAGIATDSQRIGEFMESVQKRIQRDRIPASLEQYLKNTTTLYHGLSKSLVLYSMGVRDAKKKLDESK